MLPAVAGSASLSLLTSLPAKVQLKMASGFSGLSSPQKTILFGGISTYL